MSQREGEQEQNGQRYVHFTSINVLPGFEDENFQRIPVRFSVNQSILVNTFRST